MMIQADISDTQDLKTRVVTDTSFTLNSKNYLPEQVENDDFEIVTTPVEKVSIPVVRKLEQQCKLVISQHGCAFAIFKICHWFALKIGGKRLNAIIQDVAGKRLTKNELTEINDYLIAKAEASGQITNIYTRVAPIEDGVEINVADTNKTRIRVTESGIEIITDGSTIPFFTNPLSQPMVIPAEKGDINLLKRYVNLNSPNFILLIAYLSYTLAHPKVKFSKFIILVLIGDGGAGKTFLCDVIISLLDPSSVRVQKFPRTDKDLAIITQNAHVSCFDNIRLLSRDMSDTLCIASTGGGISGRTLYTDGDQNVLPLHAPIILNGIHSFVTEPDLAQRILPLHMTVMPADARRSETEMLEEFEKDLPVIFRGLLDLISDVFKHLPNAKVTSPERMIDFSRWLAAMELAHDAPVGVYQDLYSAILNDAQFDTLVSNPLAAAIIEFTKNKHNFTNGVWSGMPSELLEELEALQSNIRQSGLPSNSIALSKRLIPIRSALLTQGIRVELSRGKNRTITIEIL
jgi:hypothetical protein